MQDGQLVSVLMSIYKERVPVVAKAIDSIRQQTYGNLELVIMLDYPEYEEMQEYLTQLSTEDARLRYYVNEKNLGLLTSLNRGLQFCNGELICRMDEDDYAEADRIEKQVQYMKSRNLDLVGSYTNLMDPDSKLLGCVRKYPGQHKYIGQMLRFTNAVPHPTWLVKKQVYEQLKGYRDIYCADDYDFLIRTYLSGYRLGIVPEPLHRYRINPKGMTQQNIASQKIVSSYLARQIKDNKIYSEQQIAEYRKQKQPQERKLAEYYGIWKRWKAGDHVPVRDKIKVIFNRYNLVELRQRIACKWILFKDSVYGNS